MVNQYINFVSSIIFSDKVADDIAVVAKRAYHEAKGLGHEYIGTEHLLLGMFGSQSPGEAVLSESYDLYRDQVFSEVVKLVKRGDSFSPDLPISPRAMKVFERADELARNQRRNLDSIHLLGGIVAVEDGQAAQVLHNLVGDRFNQMRNRYSASRRR